MEDLWVFGYGSLMWRPGFEFEESQNAKLHGLHRRLCIYSWVHRGTPERPGLVLGLDKGGSCQGMAFRVNGKKAGAVVDYLRERELVTNVYLETTRKVSLQDGRTVNALTYYADTSHEQYAPRLALNKTLAQIRGAVGSGGRNEDYVISTAQKILEIGSRDQNLEVIARYLQTN